MKAVLLILVVCVYAYSAQDYSGFNHVHKKPRDLDEIIQRKCASNSGGTQAFDRFRNAIVVVRDCVSRRLSSPELNDPVLQHEEFCTALREGDVYGCMSNFTEFLRPCLDETEAYFPDYLLTVLNTTFNELCGVNGLSNLEYFLDIIDSQNPKVKKCSKITGTLLFSETTYANLTIFKNLNENYILNLNANDLCSDLKSIHKSFSLLMKEECNADYSRFVDLQSQPFLEVCNLI